MGKAASIAETYNSNHSLQRLVTYYFDDEDNIIPTEVSDLLLVNENHEAADAARIKILKHHADHDESILWWDFKMLPIALGWFEKASNYHQLDFDGKIEERKLAAVYQFVRAMPVQFVESITGTNVDWSCIDSIMLEDCAWGLTGRKWG